MTQFTSAEDRSVERRARDLSVASVARMHNYFVGGTSYAAVDRDLGDTIARHAPHCVMGIRYDRVFTRVSATEMLNAGVDQFIDLNSGIPTGGSLHEVVHAINPSARVMYVDRDPVAIGVARQVLHDRTTAAVLDGDLRDPQAIMTHPLTQRLFDLDKPVGLFAAGVMHYLPPWADPRRIMADYRSFLAPGSYLAITAATGDSAYEEISDEIAWATTVYTEVGLPAFVHSRADVESWFGDAELIQPGLVRHWRWRPEYPLTPAQLRCDYGWVGVGRIGASTASTEGRRRPRSPERRSR